MWLDAFAGACAEQGRDYVDRVRYLMADYSPHVLELRARAASPTTAIASVRSSSTSATPSTGLTHLRGKVLFAHTCNLYDNLPTDELMRVGDRVYEPLVRASITPGEIDALSADHGVAAGRSLSRRSSACCDRVRRSSATSSGACASGRTCGTPSTSRRSTRRLPAPSALRVAPSADLHLDELLDGLPEWTRVHMSTVAVESFAQTLQLLHHEGVLVVQDLFIRDVGQYASFRGPGKLEGSIVNWLNGPIFEIVGGRSGFHVTVEPFTHRERSNTVVLTTRSRDAYTRGPETSTREVVTVP